MSSESLDLNVSYKLPPEAYYDQAWLDKERRMLFGKSWLYAGLEVDFPEAGSYKTVKAGFNDLVILRDRQGSLNAFHNACRHRGAQLVQGSGKCTTLVCPYHRWTYGMNGQLRGMPQKEQFSNIDMSELGLHRASVDTWMGLVFVHVDEDPDTSLADWLEGVKDELSVFDASQLTELKRHTFSFDANWKLYIENHIDWLHLWYVHPKTLSILDHDKGELMQYGKHWVSYEPVKEELKNSEAVRSPLIDFPHLKNQREIVRGNGAHFLFPNVAVFTGNSFFVTAELIPETPEKTTMDVRVLGVPGGDVDTFLAGFNEITKGEDVGIIENIQKNVRSSRFGVGPIADRFEQPISEFHANYLDRVQLVSIAN